MAADTASPDLSALVRQQLNELLGDPSVRQSLIGGLGFTSEYRDMLEGVNAQVGRLLQDRNLGASLNGPVWLSGTSILNGTVTAGKISVTDLAAINASLGTVNVTGTVTAAAAFPATGARVEINSSGLWGYSGAATTTFKLNTDGSGEIGTGSNKISWTTGGVVTVPTAVISSLTIADVAGGNLGGTYQTSAATTRLEFGPSYFRALASGVETFKLDASTGAVTATGSFTIKSAASGARVVIDNAGGIEGFNASSVSTFRFNAATGAGYVGGTGSGTNGISWDSSGTVSIGGASFSSGKITATSLSISTLSAISANLGTITAGTINGGTISAGTITTGTLAADRVSGGSLGGSINLGSSSLTVNSTGVITNNDGDSWGPNGITLVSAGSAGDSIQWKTSGTNRGSIYADASSMTIGAQNSTYLKFGGGGGTIDAQLQSNGDYFTRGRVYPGRQSGSIQTTYYIDAGASLAIISNGIGIGGMLGISSGNTINFISPGTGGSASSWSSFTTANVIDKSAGYFKIQIASTNYRVPFFADS